MTSHLPPGAVPKGPPIKRDIVKDIPKTRSEIPAWIEEHLAMAAIGFLILLVVMFSIFRTFLVGPPAPDPNSFAKVAVTYGPLRMYDEGSNTRVGRAKVSVKNLGPGRAKGVRVRIKALNQEFPLPGPEELDAGKTADYEGPIGIHLGLNDAFLPVVGCKNCR